MADRVIPNSLNYADIKPEAVEADIKLVKFTPTSTVTGAKGGDIVKFLLVGNGFLDPYSTYLQFEVTTDIQAGSGEIRTLDRSAHSFIQRMVIRSQGVEIERIENYDVVAAMIHDVIYSPEQCALHHWEGFPNQQMDLSSVCGYNTVAGQGIYGTTFNPDAVVNQLGGFDTHYTAPQVPSCRGRAAYAQLIGNGSSPILNSYVGEMCFSNDLYIENAIPGIDKKSLGNYFTGDKYDPAKAAQVLVDYTKYVTGVGGAPDQNALIAEFGTAVGQTNFPVDIDLMRDSLAAKDLAQFGGDGIDTTISGLNPGVARGNQPLGASQWLNPMKEHSQSVPLQYVGHSRGRRIPATLTEGVDSSRVIIKGTRKMQFQIPIYSGLIGVMQPDKKLLPINLLPLDIEITFNPHALYSNLSTGSRQYTITKFHMYSHMIFFEQEIHRSLEAAVAEHGIFIYCNQFHLAPVSLIANTILPSFAYISMNLKSINSIHMLFYYNAFETIPCARKLHFVSHNVTSLQILNGTTLIPQEPIVGLAGNSLGYEHTPFLIECYKAWNKLHDPKTDGSIEAYNYCGDQYGKQFDPCPFDLRTQHSTQLSLALLINKQGHVGRCQYGISLEGEDLGTDKTMVTGRKSQYPFLLYMKSDNKLSHRTSYMNVFLRADFIVYIRPDLQVVTLGK